MTTSDPRQLRTAHADGEVPITEAELQAIAGQVAAQVRHVVHTAAATVDAPVATPAPSPSSVPGQSQWPVDAAEFEQIAREAVEASSVPHAGAPGGVPSVTLPEAPRFDADSPASAATRAVAAPTAEPTLDAAALDRTLGLSFGVPDLSTLFGSVAEPAISATSAQEDLYRLGSLQRSDGLEHHILDDRSQFDVDALRRDFPILGERVEGQQLVWLDNAATTQKPVQVIDRLSHFYRHENSNIHRAAHELAARATDAYEEARDSVRRFIGAARDEEIVFVRGTTEAINLVASAWGDKFIGEGDEIVITHLEHHANIVPWQLLAQRTGAVIKVAPVDDSGTLLLDQFAALLGPRTKLVSATHVSNALGTVNPVAEIVRLGHRVGARVLIDGAQSTPHIPIDVQALDADFFVFSGHKVFGPTGIGVLYAKSEVLEETPPWQGGGNMIADVTLERALFQGPPNKFEAGTGNIADAVGLGEAIRYVERVGIKRINAYEHALLEYATPLLAEIPGVHIVGTSPEKASVLSFVVDGHDTVGFGARLNEYGIAVRAGHHCAQPILRRLGLEATVRPSFAFYNTKDEVHRLVQAVRDIISTRRP